MQKKYWNIGIGENTCHHVTHVTHFKIVINTRYEKEVFKNGKVKPKRKKYQEMCRKSQAKYRQNSKAYIKQHEKE